MSSIKKIFFIFAAFLNVSFVLGMTKKPLWVFLRTIDYPTNKETDEWLIKNKHLEFNINAEDSITLLPFAELIQEAQKNEKPYILIGLRSKDWFYHFVDGSYWKTLKIKWENPLTKLPPEAIEIFIAGDDGKLIFLTELDKNNWSNLDFDTLNTSGYGHLLIAKLFNPGKENINEPEVRKTISTLEARLKFINDQLELGQGAGSMGYLMELFQEGENLYKQVNNLKKTIKILPIPENLHHAEQWFNWALKYLPKNSPEYNEAEKKLQEIPHKSESLQLLKNTIQRLTINLQKLSSLLHK